jgi:hypothetical protein
MAEAIKVCPACSATVSGNKCPTCKREGLDWHHELPEGGVSVPSEWFKPGAVVPVTPETVQTLLRALMRPVCWPRSGEGRRLWIVEIGAVGLPLGHTSRLTTFEVYEKEAEARAVAEACEYNARVFSVPFPESASLVQGTESTAGGGVTQGVEVPRGGEQ